MIIIRRGWYLGTYHLSDVSAAVGAPYFFPFLLMGPICLHSLWYRTHVIAVIYLLEVQWDDRLAANIAPVPPITVFDFMVVADEQRFRSWLSQLHEAEPVILQSDNQPSAKFIYDGMLFWAQKECLVYSRPFLTHVDRSSHWKADPGRKPHSSKAISTSKKMATNPSWAQILWAAMFIEAHDKRNRIRVFKNREERV